MYEYGSTVLRTLGPVGVVEAVALVTVTDVEELDAVALLNKANWGATYW
jgi:hypothetical protein